MEDFAKKLDNSYNKLEKLLEELDSFAELFSSVDDSLIEYTDEVLELRNLSKTLEYETSLLNDIITGTVKSFANDYKALDKLGFYKLTGNDCMRFSISDDIEEKPSNEIETFLFSVRKDMSCSLHHKNGDSYRKSNFHDIKSLRDYLLKLENTSPIRECARELSIKMVKLYKDLQEL